MRALSDEAGPVSAAEARDALGRFNASNWDNKDEEKARYSIPANPRRDDDIRLGAYIDQSEKRIALLEETLRGILQEKQDDLLDCHSPGTRGTLEREIAWLESVLGGGK